MIQIIIRNKLGKKLDLLESKKAIFNQAIHEAGFMVEDAVAADIQAYPSVDTGVFAASVSTDTSVPYQTRVFTDVPYAKFLEYGTSPHFVKPRVKEALRWKGADGWFFSKGHMVGGIKPRRHFARTAMAMKDKVVEFIRQKMATPKGAE